MDLPLDILEFWRGTTPPHPCPYLGDKTASLEYRLLLGISTRQYEELLRRGWRRHGSRFFRPACPRCTECRSLRLDVQAFSPSKSQRRTLRRNRDVQQVVQSPSVTSEHIRVFNAYHADMAIRRGWPEQTVTEDEYYEAFLSGQWEFAREFLYFRDRRLIGVGLVDAVHEGLSSVYFYHDPDWRPDGPGTYSLLQEIRFAQQSGRRFHYLGYWIEACPSMSYKARFQPHQLLDVYCDDDQPPHWNNPAEVRETSARAS